jgi:hypothetical protein
MLILSNFIKALLLSISFLLLTGCSDGKKDTETTSTQNSQTTRPQATPTPEDTKGLKSLTLTVDKTTLKKDENTTVKVIATYRDGTSKNVTEKVEWVINPRDTVTITEKILIAKKDHKTTFQAKLSAIFSNSVELNIIWEVNGHILPPEPDPQVNNSTLLGIDSNDNGVRDDVERWIYETYKDKHPIHIDIAMQAGRAYKQVLETPERAKEIRLKVNGPYFCASYYQNYAKYFNESILVHERIDTPVKSKYFNTKERSDVYWQYDTLLSGDSYSLPKIREMKSQCDFNTTQYEK